MKRHTALKVLLAIVCVSHLILGTIAFTSMTGPIERTAHAFYGASLTLTPELTHVIRIVGAFMLAIGFMAALAFASPEKHVGVINGVVVLLVLRSAQRLIFAGEVQKAFAIPPQRLLLQSVFFLSLGVALFLLRPKGAASVRA